jgi:hypothetical protein
MAKKKSKVEEPEPVVNQPKPPKPDPKSFLRGRDRIAADEIEERTRKHRNRKANAGVVRAQKAAENG